MLCRERVETRDETREVEMQKTLIECGVLTVDEVRAMRGLPPLVTPTETTQTSEVGE